MNRIEADTATELAKQFGYFHVDRFTASLSKIKDAKVVSDFVFGFGVHFVEENEPKFLIKYVYTLIDNEPNKLAGFQKFTDFAEFLRYLVKRGNITEEDAVMIRLSI